MSSWRRSSAEAHRGAFRPRNCARRRTKLGAGLISKLCPSAFRSNGSPDRLPQNLPSADSAPRSLRDEINADVVMLPRKPAAKPSVRLWLHSLEGRLGARQSLEQVEAVALSNDVCKAGKALQGDARDQLRLIINAALHRHCPKA
jgi:hypothetical protein